jgi:DNA-binding response OmpR family regulator
MDASWTSDQRRVNDPPVIVLVDDEPDFAAMVREFLRREGYRVLVAGDVRGGGRLIREHHADLVVLDLGLPDRSGLDLLRGLRQNDATPVIIMSGHGSEAARIVGLELGADDYLVKPVSLAELAARVRAVLRRGRPVARTLLRVGRLHIDTDAREVSIEGAPLALSPLEYELLAFLASSPRRVFTPAQLLENIWGLAGRQEARTVAEHVYRLRRKLADADIDSPRLTTVRGAGYRLDP